MGIRVSILFCGLLCQANAADSGITGSILGFFFDPANGLQPILGIPGASTIGPPIDLATTAASVAISPQQDYALAAGASNTNLLRIVARDVASVQPLGIQTASDLIALSPTGSAAAFYDRARSRIQVIAGLPENASLAHEFDISMFPDTLISLAVSDDAGAVLAGFPQSTVALGPEGSIRLIAGSKRATAARFLVRKHDAVIADGSANAVYIVRDVTGSPEPILIAGEADGILEPIAVAVSNDNKRAFVASSRSRAVAAIEIASGEVTVYPCQCAPSGLASLSGNAVFRLTEPSDAPMWLFDGDSKQPRVVFVPPYRPGAEETAR